MWWNKTKKPCSHFKHILRYCTLQLSISYQTSYTICAWKIFEMLGVVMVLFSVISVILLKISTAYYFEAFAVFKLINWHHFGPLGDHDVLLSPPEEWACTAARWPSLSVSRALWSPPTSPPSTWTPFPRSSGVISSTASAYSPVSNGGPHSSKLHSKKALIGRYFHKKNV